MIEVVGILILMAILGAFVVNRFGDPMGEADVAGAAEVVRNHLRYAQSKAMNSNMPWGLQFNGGTYTLQNTNTPPDTDTLPGELPQGMTFTATLALTPATVVNPVLFENRWGSPVDNTLTPWTDNITVTVSKGGVSRAITVTRNTGFIP